MRGRVQCARCTHLDEQEWCLIHGHHVPFARHWRRCNHYAGPQPLATIRSNLAAAGLERYVAELRDVPEGRLLRLELGTPTAERFDIYRLVGITVIDNIPPTLSAPERGRRGHPGVADDSDPEIHRSNVA